MIETNIKLGTKEMTDIQVERALFEIVNSDNPKEYPNQINREIDDYLGTIKRVLNRKNDEHNQAYLVTLNYELRILRDCLVVYNNIETINRKLGTL